MSIRVLRPGLLTTLQDHGRHGFQRVGLCPGGAMDQVSLALANGLVGNPPDEAALEITVIGPEIEFQEDTLVAVCGAEFESAFPHNRPVLARKGTRFNVGRAKRGARAYIAVAGGFFVCWTFAAIRRARSLRSNSLTLPGVLANIARMLLVTSVARFPASTVACSAVMALCGSGCARFSQLSAPVALVITALSGCPTSCEIAADTASIDISRASRSRFRAAVDSASRA
jgi:hypothetical protein